MFRVEHADNDYSDYYQRLEELVATVVSQESCSLHVTQTLRPKCSAQQMAKYLNHLLQQPDWDIVALDSSASAEDTKEIWESFDDFHLHLRDIPPKKETRLPEAYLSRERRHQRCGYITKQLFTKKCHKLKKHEKISFLYYIAAVVATFAACYFLHFASKRKN